MSRALGFTYTYASYTCTHYPSIHTRMQVIHVCKLYTRMQVIHVCKLYTYASYTYTHYPYIHTSHTHVNVATHAYITFTFAPQS